MSEKDVKPCLSWYDFINMTHDIFLIFMGSMSNRTDESNIEIKQP